MNIEVGHQYAIDGQIITIIYVCEQYANSLYLYQQAFKRYLVIGINQHGHKRYFTYIGIHLYLTEYNFIGYKKQRYLNKIGKYIMNIFKRIC
jgi:hypothetical protein